MGFKVNFADTELKDFTPLNAGSYIVYITNGEVKESGPKSKNPGSQYISWEFTVDGGEYNNRKLWMNTSLLPQALFGLKALCLATGKWSSDEIESPSFDFEIEDLIGSRIKVTVTKREYPEGSGEYTNDVKNPKPLDGGAAATAAVMPAKKSDPLLP